MKGKVQQLLIISLIVIIALLVFIFSNKMQEPGGFTIMGIIDYEGLPEPEFFPIHGFKYYLIVDETQREKVNGFERVVLLGNLNPELEGKQVVLKGQFIENYIEYKVQKGMQITSADPQGAVILVESIE